MSITARTFDKPSFTFRKVNQLCKLDRIKGKTFMYILDRLYTRMNADLALSSLTRATLLLGCVNRDRLGLGCNLPSHRLLSIDTLSAPPPNFDESEHGQDGGKGGGFLILSTEIYQGRVTSKPCTLLIIIRCAAQGQRWRFSKIEISGLK
jgi:hypothetical protein